MEYSEMVTILNMYINKFNDLLNENVNVPLIEEHKMIDKNYYVSLNENSWNDLRFPSSNKKGVYFIFGNSILEDDKKSLYIGKASFNSTIGKRLHSHLVRYRNDKMYIMNDNYANKHKLNYLIAIDMESVGVSFLAPALEEYLIINARDYIYLLNGTGNK